MTVLKTVVCMGFKNFYAKINLSLNSIFHEGFKNILINIPWLAKFSWKEPVSNSPIYHFLVHTISVSYSLCCYI